MTLSGWIQIALYCAIVTVLVKPFGGFITRVVTGERTFLTPVLGPIERAILPRVRRHRRAEQHWITYAVSMLAFSVAGFLSLYAMQRLQAVLPFNPQGLDPWRQTSPQHRVSFVTNTTGSPTCPRAR